MNAKTTVTVGAASLLLCAVACNPTEPQIACPNAEVVFEAENSGVNLLFVLDRSGSMHLPIAGGATRWTATKAALFTMFDDLEYRANGAITMFPAGDQPLTCCPVTNPNCGMCSDADVPAPDNRCAEGSYQGAVPALMTPERIHGMKAKVSLSDDEHYWGTPLAAAVSGAVQSLDAIDSSFAHAVVLLTDGKPAACATEQDPDADDVTLAIDATRAAYEEMGVRTYVVGVIDGDRAADAEHLSRLATAGGTARYPGCSNDTDCAYSVNVDTFHADVAAALADIARQATSCTFTLERELEAPLIELIAGDAGALVDRDPDHGWSFDNATTIRLNGDACETFKSTPGATVQVQTSCDI